MFFLCAHVLLHIILHHLVLSSSYPLLSLFSVYIAVLWWHCMSHRVWHVSRQRYIFTWFVLRRCLRDLRGDVEAKQGKVHAWVVAWKTKRSNAELG